MNPKEIGLIKKVAEIFEKNEDYILGKWIELVKKENIISNDVELGYYKDGFKKLIEDFSYYLKNADFEGYYRGNSELAKEIAYNDISYPKFVEAFHLFEDSYNDLLSRNIAHSELLRCLGAIDKLHHTTISRVSQAYFEINDVTVFALAKLAELRDPETGYHLERTREYSVMLATEIGCAEDFVNNIYKVGPLHDIGKVGIPDRVLLKPAALTEEEYAEMKKHPVIGADVILSIIADHHISRGYLLMARDIILHHHEKYDGTGYPCGLKGEEIPLAARIFSIVDAYDAIVSKRPYKPALPHEEALKRIKKDSGTHFDPALVEAFFRIHEKLHATYEKYKDDFKFGVKVR
ncbi:MAG TPA: HD domain-containing phosphohydrolase [Candidatus Wallbacteria bacterium]|nr:HD domain-containing phosphohydrolase [Candidatus Wallbacteria bacterium]